MNKLKLPKYPHKGLKIFCKTCNADNTDCRHYSAQVYRVRVHVPGTKNTIRARIISARSYLDAIIEVIDFEKELVATNFRKIENMQVEDVGNDYSIADAIIRYNQYLNGETVYAHLKKNFSIAYRDELLRYCRFFCKSFKDRKEITRSRVREINKSDIANFYLNAEKHYGDKSFNKCMSSIKGFFDFLIEIEEVEMKNPLRTYESKQVFLSEVNVVTKNEFESILRAVGTTNPFAFLGKNNDVKKNMFKPYLTDGFKLFLMIGGRREELVDLRWNNIFISPTGTKFFRIENLKVMRAKKRKEKIYKYAPINNDLFKLLVDMGYNKKFATEDYILYPNRGAVKCVTICDQLSKSFTHYRKNAGIVKEIGLSHLRKTYLTWVNQVMNHDTKILSSHATDGVLKEYYLDPTILNAIEKGALEIKIFGEGQEKE